MKETIVALYHSPGAAYSSIGCLLENQFPISAIGLILHPLEDSFFLQPGLSQWAQQMDGLMIAPVAEIDRIVAAGTLADALSARPEIVAPSLRETLIAIGIPKHYAEFYLEALLHGSALVALTTESENIKAGVVILRRFNPVDVEQQLAVVREQHRLQVDSLYQTL